MFKLPAGVLAWPLLLLLAGLIALAAAPSAHAAQFEPEGRRLMVVGNLDLEGAAQLGSLIADKDIRTVVFENSFGGTPEAAQAWSAAVRASGVNTEVTGQCHDACALVFLAGKEHRFARGLQVNGVLIPMAARPRLESQQQQQQPLAVLVADSAQNPAERAADWRPGQGLLFTSTPTLFGRVYNTFWCDGSQGRDISRCERVSKADPFKLGVLMELR